MNDLRHRMPFEELPRSSGGLSGSFVSISLHSGVLLFIVFGLRHTPQLGPATARQHETVRLMNLRDPLPEEHSAVTVASGESSPTATPSPSAHHAVMAKVSPPILFAPRIHATQTLLQPDAPPDAILPHATPIPFVMVWSAQATPIEPTVSTSPVQVLIANEHPSLSAPNHEVTAAEIKIAATPFHTAAPMPTPSTASPVIATKPAIPPTAPLTVSNAIGQPVPARIMSLSDLELKNGTIAIPLANSVAASSPTDSTSLLRAKGSQTAQDSTNGTSTATVTKPQSAVSVGNGNATTPGEATKGDSKGDSHAKVAATSGAGSSAQGPAPIVSRVDERNIIRIHRPKDGQFGVVVVGSAVAEEYPEAKELWGGRLVYTVYLHIGTGKNWILQYSLPRSAEASSSGSSVRPEPPWPYELARPAPSEADLDADTTMIHGYVTVEGRLDKTSVVFPAAVPNAKALLDVLGLWLFRPAHQNGQPTSVEVLLIIPAEGA